MIEWRKYDPTDRSIPSHVPHLVSNGERFMVAMHQKSLESDGYEWAHSNAGYRVGGVTHWAPIHLPGENAERVEITITECIGDAISSKTFEIGRGPLFHMPKRSTSRANRFVTNYLEEIIERINLPGEEEA